MAREEYPTLAKRVLSFGATIANHEGWWHPEYGFDVTGAIHQSFL